jgi:hypothetical protein
VELRLKVAKCAAELVGQAVSPANCEIETMAGERACPTSDASPRRERKGETCWKLETKTSVAAMIN